MVRRLLVVVLALLLAVQVVRNSAVAALAERSPDAASRLWPGHPAVEISLGMTEIGRAAHQRRPVGAKVFALIEDAAVKAPLAPEPFLVRGVQAQLEGQSALAAQAFEAAEWRDPRSLPARYFLADIFYRTGNVRRTIEEIGVLARLAPNGVQSIAPYIAAYAKDRSSWPYVRQLFRSDRGLEDVSLTALAADAANADAILALADEKARSARSDWAPTLVKSLINAGQYAKARAVWAATSQVRLQPDKTLYDAAFVDSKSPPPFNWSLESSTVGLAERQPGGRLHVIYYGQEDGVLAQELLVLPPGTYRLTMAVSGDLARSQAMSWSIRCDRSQKPFASISLDSAPRGWVFSVPAGCPAQWLELSGASSDVAHQSEITIKSVKLLPERPNA
jgi:hypothetical protein